MKFELFYNRNKPTKNRQKPTITTTLQALDLEQVITTSWLKHDSERSTRP